MIKKIIIVMGVLFLIIGTAYAGILFNLSKTGGTDPDYQHDADIVRMNDLVKIGGYLEEYKEKSGRYPFTNISDLPVYIFIATEEQHPKEEMPIDYIEKDISELIRELERVLERKIKMPFDPQKRGVNKPNFYIYMTRGDDYYLAIHLYNSFDFTKNIGEYYNKLEISNNSNEDNKIWNYEGLLKDSAFKKARSEKMFKKSYFDSLRDNQN